MPGQFIIRVEARFEAAHNLREYKGVPEPLHGHSWKVEAKFKCKKLDHEDIGIDYVHVEKTIRQLASRFDHKYIVRHRESFYDCEPSGYWFNPACIASYS